MSATTTERDGRTIVIEDVGPNRKKLTITVAPERVTDQLEMSMATLAADASVPGFRKGKAPRALLEKRFGSAVREEAKNQLVSSGYSAAIEEHKLRVLGDPDADEELATAELEAGSAFTFSVEVEIPPEFDLPDLEGIEVKKPLIEVRDEEVEEQISRITVNEGRLEGQDASRRGDYCIGNASMKAAGGDVLLELEDAVIQIPEEGTESGAILDVMVEDFAKQVGTPNPGDALVVKATGPEQHEREDVRGAKLEISFTVDRVERIVPASEEQLVEQFGFADTAELRESVMLRLNQRALLEQQSAMRKQVADQLVHAVEFELPEKQTERQIERSLSRRRMDMMYRGVPEQEIERQLAEQRAATAEEAARELKLFFILSKAADDMEVQVSEEEVMGRVAQIAAERGMRPDQLRQELMERNQVGVVAQQVREHKTLDALLSRATVVEVTQAEFEKEFASA